jgi:putative membrane protein
VTGVYEAVITSAGHLVSGVRALLVDRPRARAQFAAVRWDVIVPLLVGMVPALVIALRFLGPALEDHPVQMRALFFGMVAASLVVPVSLLEGRWRARDMAAVGAGAATAFLLSGTPQLAEDPGMAVVFLAAAVAVCALVLPGVSGAFLLLMFGMYESTAAAVREPDIAYLAVFGLGMVFGLSLFVKGLQWLLEHRRRVTLAAMTGLVLGALRALWPWQTDDRGLVAPGPHLGVAVVAAALGAAVVLGIIWIERRSRPSRVDHGQVAATRRRHAQHRHDQRDGWSGVVRRAVARAARGGR